MRKVKTELKLGDLIGYRVHAVNGEAGALRDLVVEPDVWLVRYLVVGADAWAPGHQVLLAPRSLASIDEVRRELETELSMEQVRSSPALGAGAEVESDLEENWYRYDGWTQYWQAEIDEETAPEPPGPPAPPADEPLPRELAADGPDLLRFEGIRFWKAVTTDQIAVPLIDLLLDDSDWSIDYFEIEIENQSVRERCLVDDDYVIGADPETEQLYLALDAETLQQAPRRPHPGVGEHGDVRTAERAVGP